MQGDLWGHPEVNSGGGAWYPPAIDTEAASRLLGRRQPGPVPRHPGVPQRDRADPGDNLYTDSAVALDLDTGELRWYHQVHPHDLFDRDLVHTLIAQAARRRPVVVATGKGGVVVGLDRATGERRLVDAGGPSTRTTSSPRSTGPTPCATRGPSAG